jgi:hypothetical protein
MLKALNELTDNKWYQLIINLIMIILAIYWIIAEFAQLHSAFGLIMSIAWLIIGLGAIGDLRRVTKNWNDPIDEYNASIDEYNQSVDEENNDGCS